MSDASGLGRIEDVRDVDEDGDVLAHAVLLWMTAARRAKPGKGSRGPRRRSGRAATPRGVTLMMIVFVLLRPVAFESSGAARSVSGTCPRRPRRAATDVGRSGCGGDGATRRVRRDLHLYGGRGHGPEAAQGGCVTYAAPHHTPRWTPVVISAHDGLRRSGCIARVEPLSCRDARTATGRRPARRGEEGRATWEFRLGPGVLGAPHHVPVTVAGSGRPPASRRSTQEENQEP